MPVSIALTNFSLMLTVRLEFSYHLFPIFIMAVNADIYRSFQRLLVEQKREGNALEVAEQGRYRSYKELLSNYLLVNCRKFEEDSPPNVEEIKQIVQASRTTLVYYSVLYDEQQVYRLYRFNAAIQDQHHIYPTELFIWVIQPTGQLEFRVVDLKSFWQKYQVSLACLVASIHQVSLETGKLKSKTTDFQEQYQKHLNYLYQLLIEPIEAFLPQNPDDLVTFAPQDFLYLVPFAALMNNQGQYLIEKHSLSLAPSLRMLNILNQLSAKQGQITDTTAEVLVVGNPTMPSLYSREGGELKTLSPLPEAEIEAHAIAHLFNTEALIGAKATKAHILAKISSAKLIHFATYGLLSNAYGFPCAIALAPEQHDRGLLTAREIMNLELQAELVVISVTYPQQGNIWGNGVEGLARAFFSAGVPSVLLAIWYYPHSPNVELLSLFYRYWRESGNQAQALRQAILKIKAEYPHPQDWAAFTLLGRAC